jgi:hypothetical protein
MTPAQFKSNPGNDIRVDAEIIKARMDDPSFVVVDARTPMESMHASRGCQTLCRMTGRQAWAQTAASLQASRPKERA